MLTGSLWDLSRKGVDEAELCLGDHQHSKQPPVDFNTGQKMNQGWETWVPRMAYFLSSFAIIFFLLTAGKKVKVNSTQVLDLSCQIKRWSHGLLAQFCH